MKHYKFLRLITVILSMVLLASASVFANQDIRVYMNDEQIEFEVEPVVVNGSTLVPMRTIFEKLGANVDWDNDAKTAIAMNDTAYMSITIGSPVMYTYTETIELETPAMVVDGSTMIPLRAVSEAFDCDVVWDGATKTVNIYSKDYTDETAQDETLENVDDTQESVESTTESEEEAEYIPEITDRPLLIAHAGGQIYGYKLTNSKEALDRAYENGFRYIELDFEMTSDREYVLIHDWQSMAERMINVNYAITKSEFLSAETFNDLTLLDFYALIDWIKLHDDCYIITDVKCDNLPFIDKISFLKDMKDRFIVQVYSIKEYYYAKKMGLENIILTLYRTSLDEKDIISFIEDETPWAITLPEYYATEKLLQELRKNGIASYIHTIDDLYLYEEYKEMGVYGIYTNYFEPNHWEG